MSLMSRITNGRSDAEAEAGNPAAPEAPEAPQEAGDRRAARAQRPAKAPREPKPPREPRVDRQREQAQAAPEWKSAYKPGVILLPTKERTASVKRKSIRNASMVSGGMLVLAIAGYIAVAMSYNGAQASLDTHNELKSQHESALAAAEPITDYVAGIGVRKDAAVTALQSDTAYSKVISEVQAANTFGANITGIAIGDTSGVLSGHPFEASGASGYLRFDGVFEGGSTSEGIRKAGAFAEALSSREGLITDAYATTAMREGETVRFSLTVGYTEEAYTFRGLAFSDAEDAETKEDQSPAEGQGTATEETGQ